MAWLTCLISVLCCMRPTTAHAHNLLNCASAHLHNFSGRTESTFSGQPLFTPAGARHGGVAFAFAGAALTGDEGFMNVFQQRLLRVCSRLFRVFCSEIKFYLFCFA